MTYTLFGITITITRDRPRAVRRQWIAVGGRGFEVNGPAAVWPAWDRPRGWRWSVSGKIGWAPFKWLAKRRASET